MKNLKKVLALVTVAAMMLSCVPAFASSYSDVSDSASYAEAVEMTSALGIFTGYEDGTFLPNNTITRAEAAAVIARFLGQDATAKAMAGTTQFTDMADAAWATGYVNFGVQKNFINGMGDGTYAPSAEVTYEQIVKMIVAALGYSIKAEDQGGYPSGYLSVASTLEITKGTSGSNGAATRATVARLIYNALEVNKMVISKYNSDGTKEYSETGKPVLYDDLKVDAYVGVVTDTYLNGLTDVDADATVTVDYTEKDGVAETDNVTLLIADSDALNFLGQQVKVYVAENEETGDDEIIGIYAKGNKNTVVTVNRENVDSVSANKVSYYKDKDNDKKTTDIDLNNVKVFKNNETGAVADIKAANGMVTFISNDGSTSNGYEYAIVTAYTDEFVVDEIEGTRLNALNTGRGLKVDMTDDASTVYTFVKDGKSATFNDIKVGDTVSVAKAGNVYVLYVSSDKVEGKVSQVNTAKTKFTIAGTEYEKTADCDTIALSDEGTFYLNVDGKIVDFDATSDVTGSYGYFIAADATTSFGKNTWEIKFVDEKGSEVRAYVAEKYKVGTGKVGSTSVKAEDMNDTRALFGGVSDVTLFKYDTNSAGEITKLITPGSANAGETSEFNKDRTVAKDSETYKAADNKAGKVYFDDATVVFSAKATVSKASDVKVVKLSAVFEDGEKVPAFTAYDMDKNDVAAAIVAVDATAKIDAEDNVLVVTKVTTTKAGADEEDATVITGLQKGEVVSYTVCDAEEDYNGVDPQTLKKGDIVMLAVGNEYVTDLVVKNVSAEDYKSENYKSGKYAEDIVVDVKTKSNGRVTFNEYTAYNDEKIDTMTLNKNSINFTLVSTVGANTQVEEAGFGDIDVDSLGENDNGYKYRLYIRIADDTIVDVVIIESK